MKLKKSIYMLFLLSLSLFNTFILDVNAYDQNKPPCDHEDLTETYCLFLFPEKCETCSEIVGFLIAIPHIYNNHCGDANDLCNLRTCIFCGRETGKHNDKPCSQNHSGPPEGCGVYAETYCDECGAATSWQELGHNMAAHCSNNGHCSKSECSRCSHFTGEHKNKCSYVAPPSGACSSTLKEVKCSICGVVTGYTGGTHNYTACSTEGCPAKTCGCGASIGTHNHETPNPPDDPNNPNNQNPDNASPNNNGNNPSCADPVLLSTGAFYTSKTDLQIAALIPLSFKRSYNNQIEYNGVLGYNWDFSFNKRLDVKENGDVIIFDPNNKAATMQLKYIKNGDNYVTPNGFFRTLTKDGDFYIEKDIDNNKWIFNLEGKLTKISDKNNNNLTFDYDEHNKLTKVSDDFSNFIKFYYNENWRISSINDSMGRSIFYEYDQNFNLVKITKPGNIVTTYEYDSNHNIIKSTNARGEIYLENTYDENQRVIHQVYNGAEATFAYDTVNNKTTYTDWRGYVTDYYIDSVTGNLVKKVQHTANLRDGDPASYITLKEYNDQNLLAKKINPNGSVVIFSYDSKGRLTEKRFKKNATAVANDDIVETYAYEENHSQPTSITDSKGNITVFTYDENGNRLTVKDALLNITNFTYDSNGRISLSTSNSGVVSKYNYSSENGLLISQTQDFGNDKLNITSQYQYDEAGRVINVTDPKQNVTTITYNNQGLTQSVKQADSTNIITLFEYDQDGNNIKQRKLSRNDGSSWYTIEREFDQRNNVTKVVNQERETTKKYDNSGNLIKITDAEGKSTHFNYDERGLLWKETDALNNTTEYFYTLNGQLAKIKDAKGNETNYEYDSFDRQTKIIYPDSSYEEFTYDKNSNVTSKRTRKGIVISYVYDALNRLTSKTASDTGTVSYVYDNESRMTSVTNENGSLSYTFDNLGRVIQATDTESRILKYEYDANGNQVKLIYPDNSFVIREFDEVNRLTAINDDQNNSIASFTYTPLSRLKNINYGNGISTNYTMDYYNRISKVSHNLNNDKTRIYQYYYNNVDLITGKSHANGDMDNYTYDNIYQLKRVLSSNEAKNISFNFDKLGNRVNTTKDNLTENYIANNLNQYTSIGSSALTYDANGNLTSYDGNSYEYDSDNRLKKIITAENVIFNHYDAVNRRIKKYIFDKSGNLLKAVHYLYDGDNVLSEYDATNNEKVRYVNAGLDKPIRRTVKEEGNSTDYYYHFDAQNNVTDLSDSSGNLVESYSYDVYGKFEMFDADGNALNESIAGNEYFFTGRRYEAKSNLYYYRARFYSPVLGRFLQPDPIGYGDGLNIYRYCGNDPVNFTDPAGLCAEYNADGSIWDDIGHIANGFLEGLSDGSAGVADGLTGIPFTDYSITEAVRNGFNINNIHSQSNYNGGKIGGTVAQTAITTIAYTPGSTLYHFTSKANAAKIAANGFKPTTSGGLFGNGVIYATKFNSRTAAWLSGARSVETSIAIPTAGKTIGRTIIPGAFKIKP